MGSHHKKKKGTDDSRIIIADIKKDADQDAIRTVLVTGLEMSSPGVPRQPVARATIDFVNVTETIDPAQSAGGAGDSVPPAQVTGLAATGVSNSQINLNWNANSEPDLNHYDVYRSTTNGFTVTLGVTVPVGSPSTNSYPDSGLSASTTYYYRVGAVDNSANLGPVSTQASATTLAAGSLIPSLELHLDSNFIDSSPNSFAVGGNNSNGFILPGAFGSAGWKCNTPVLGSGDYLIPGSTPPIPTALEMDTAVGFSVSFWINPQDLSAIANRRGIINNRLNSTNCWAIDIDSAGIMYFCVQKAGTDYKRQKTGFVTGSWQHVAAVFNGAANTVELYRDAVAGASSSIATQYSTDSINFYYTNIGYTVGYGGNAKYVGYYDEIRYYKSIVLTPTQVTNLKNTNAP